MSQFGVSKIWNLVSNSFTLLTMYDMFITHWIIRVIIDLIEKTHYYIKIVSISFTITDLTIGTMHSHF
jgi:hypothetical protein